MWQCQQLPAAAWARLRKKRAKQDQVEDNFFTKWRLQVVTQDSRTDKAKWEPKTMKIEALETLMNEIGSAQIVGTFD